MKIISFIVFSFSLCLLSGCVSPDQAAKIDLINLTQEYIDSKSEVEKKALIPRIERAFVTLSEMGDDHFKVPNLPPDIKENLMKDIDYMGFGAKDPKWLVAYSCNGFHYIVEFTCLVKREIVSSDKGKTEEWIYDTGRTYFLYDGESLVEYPVLKMNNP